MLRCRAKFPLEEYRELLEQNRTKLICFRTHWQAWLFLGQKIEPRITLAQARALIQKILQAWMDELIAQDSSEPKPE